MMYPFGNVKIVLCSLIFLSLSITHGIASVDWEIDMTATVARVIDGDTFDGVTVGRVRLADIDTPEVGQPDAREATHYLKSLVYRKRVFLDVDDVSRRDRYGRLVAVVYVRHNDTHLLNVNYALLQADLADVADFDNEFDTATWTPYVYSRAESDSDAESALGLLMLGCLIAVFPGLVGLWIMVCSRVAQRRRF